MPRFGGPRGGNDKSKDFVGSMKRLIKSLKAWKYLVGIALVLAMVSAILSLVTPNKLSVLTDYIEEGISPDISKLEELQEEMVNNFKNDDFQKKVNLVLTSSNISNQDKVVFQQLIANIDKVSDESDLVNLVVAIPNDVLKVLLSDITIDNIEISVDDQVELISLYAKGEEINVSTLTELPTSIQKLIGNQINLDKVRKLAIFIGCLYLVSAVFNYIQGLLMTTVSNRYAQNLRTKISKKINTLPLKFFDQHETGDILSRVTNDVDTVAQNLNQSASSLVSSITLFVGSIIMMFSTNVIMAFTAILSSLIGFFFMSIILMKSQKFFNKKQTELGDLNGYIEEMYSGHNVVRAYNGENRAILEFSKINNRLYDANKMSSFLSGLMMPIMDFVGNLGYVCVCVVGAILVNNGSISMGVIIAFMIYVRLFINPLSQIAQATSSMQSTAAASERVFEFLDEEQEPSQEQIKKLLKKDKVQGAIEFRHVNFGYDAGKTIIKDFSTKVKPGQKIAIVGPTGAGKTTIVNLLMKFYDILGGDILIDGVSIKDLSRENIHDLFCMVLQDTWLFDGTIRDNIRYNKENVSDEVIWNACKTVGIDHFIKTLPGGLDAVVSDNDTVSSGQKQLFTIARGVLKDAPLLILDEATSNVDTRTEELVQKAMDKLTKGRTSFIIAHRLSTIKNADLILVMRDGNIVEQGMHDELIAMNGFYAELYNSQFEL